MKEFDNLKDDIKILFENYKPRFVTSVMIYGSYARGEAVLGWSDFDIMIFIESNHITNETFEILESINVNLSRKYVNIPINS